MNGKQSDYTQMAGRCDAWVKNSLAQTVKLNWLGANQTDFSLEPGSNKAPEHLPFAHQIGLGSTTPASPF